jgi:hypothetical protein
MHLFLSCCLPERFSRFMKIALLFGWVCQPLLCLGHAGGLGEAALHSERRGGEHSRQCLPIPPKELNAKSNVDCIRMQPSIRWNVKENVDCSREAELSFLCVWCVPFACCGGMAIMHGPVPSCAMYVLDGARVGSPSPLPLVWCAGHTISFLVGLYY